MSLWLLILLFGSYRKFWWAPWRIRSKKKKEVKKKEVKSIRTGWKEKKNLTIDRWYSCIENTKKATDNLLKLMSLDKYNWI